MRHLAAVVLAGEEPAAGVPHVSTENQGEVILADELLPELLAVVHVFAGQILVRAIALRLAFLCEVVTGAVYIEVSVGDENRLPPGYLARPCWPIAQLRCGAPIPGR